MLEFLNSLTLIVNSLKKKNMKESLLLIHH